MSPDTNVFCRSFSFCVFYTRYVLSGLLTLFHRRVGLQHEGGPSRIISSDKETLALIT